MILVIAVIGCKDEDASKSNSTFSSWVVSNEKMSWRTIESNEYLVFQIEKDASSFFTKISTLRT